MAKIKKVFANIDEETHRKARIKAARTGKTVAEVLRECITEWVKDEPSPESSGG